MKHTILGFSQKVGLELGLDIEDLLLLRWFVDFKDSGHMVSRIINDETYYWVNYEKVLEALPILQIKKNAIYRKFKKMTDKQVLKRTTLRVAGTFSFFNLDKNYDLLINFDDLGWNNSKKSNSQKIPNESPQDNCDDFEMIFESDDFEQKPFEMKNSQTELNEMFEQNINLLNSSNKLGKTWAETPLEYRLAAFLFKNIRNINPQFKEPNLDAWSNEFHQMLIKDHRNVKDIEDIIQWVYVPGNFWNCQILNARKFRLLFDRLLMTKTYEEERQDAFTRASCSPKMDLSEFEIYE